MKRRYCILSLCLTLTVLFSGCMNQPRRTVPGPQQGQEPSQDQQIEDPQQGQQQGQQQSQTDTAPYISATYEKADIDSVVATGNVAVRSGASQGSPVLYTVTNGTTVRVLAKYDGWYVVYHNNRVGFMPMDSTRLGTPTATRPVPDVPGSTGNTLATEESTMINLINQERAKEGLKPLSANTELSKLARLKSKDIADNNYFSHTSPTYGSPFEMMKNNGINYMYAGENLAKNSTVQAAHQALMNSTGHRKNILNATFTEVGIGVITDEGNMKVYTQMFIGR